MDSAKVGPTSFPQTSTAVDDRRAHERIAGPFEGRRLGALETPVTIYDLSEGGCFINAMHQQRTGVVFGLKIDLPYVGTVTLKAETLYYKPEFGFAVRFVEMTEMNIVMLQESIAALKQNGY